MHTKQTLIANIKALGIQPDDLVTCHISLKAVGPIDAGCSTGADVMLDALRECVPNGLLMVPTHTFHLFADRPTEPPTFDIRNTMPCIGAVPTVAVKRANDAYDRGDKTILRSWKPTHSVVVFGEKAEEYIREDAMAPVSTPSFGCLAKLPKLGGKILLIGVDLRRNTFIHYLDDLMSPAPYRPFYTKMVHYDGTEELRVSASTKGSSMTYQDRYGKLLDEGGALSYGKIGDADVIVCDARKTMKLIVGAWDELNP